jgi:hypothetical protein
MTFHGGVKLLVAGVVLGISSPAWSAISQENLLDPSYYNGPAKAPRIDMTDIDLRFNKGNGKFKGKSTHDTTFTLFALGDGAGAHPRTFTGRFELNASVNKNTGEFRSGDFTFTERRFDGHRNHDHQSPLLFGGKLTSVGWSESEGFLEFGSGNFTGSLCQNAGWCSKAERIWFNTESDDDGDHDGLGLVKNGKFTSFHGDDFTGTAVLPVPAAVWLLGSGLVGLLGFAKRKEELVPLVV